MWWFDKHVFLKNKITIQNVHFKKWINVILIDDITSVIILIICHWSVNNSLFLKYLKFIYKIIIDFILSVIQKT